MTVSADQKKAAEEVRDEIQQRFAYEKVIERLVPVMMKLAQTNPTLQGDFSITLRADKENRTHIFICVEPGADPQSHEHSYFLTEPTTYFDEKQTTDDGIAGYEIMFSEEIGLQG